jgi:hypothetical protein
MTWTVIFQVAVLLASLGAGGGVFTAFLGRSKVHAETTAVLTGISAKQIEQLQSDLEKTQNKQHSLERALYAHQRWDIMVLKKLESVGVTDIPDPPDIWVN